MVTDECIAHSHLAQSGLAASAARAFAERASHRAISHPAHSHRAHSQSARIALRSLTSRRQVGMPTSQTLAGRRGTVGMPGVGTAGACTVGSVDAVDRGPVVVGAVWCWLSNRGRRRPESSTSLYWVDVAMVLRHVSLYHRKL